MRRVLQKSWIILTFGALFFLALTPMEARSFSYRPSSCKQTLSAKTNHTTLSFDLRNYPMNRSTKENTWIYVSIHKKNTNHMGEKVFKRNGNSFVGKVPLLFGDGTYTLKLFSTNSNKSFESANHVCTVEVKKKCPNGAAIELNVGTFTYTLPATHTNTIKVDQKINYSGTILVEVRKQNDRISNRADHYFFELSNRRLQEQIQLNRGPGRYTLSFAPYYPDGSPQEVFLILNIENRSTSTQSDFALANYSQDSYSKWPMSFEHTARLDEPLGWRPGPIYIQITKLKHPFRGQVDTWVVPGFSDRLQKDIYLRYGRGLYEVALFQNSHCFRSVIVERRKPLERNLYLEPSARVQSDHQKIKELAAEITAPYQTERDRSWAIFSKIGDSISYDVDLRNNMDGDPLKNHSALETLQNGKGVCTGFADLNAALHRAIGIPAKVVGSNSKDHAWNEVWIDERWQIQDPTSGASSRIAGTRIFIPATSEKRAEAFDITPEKDHLKEYIRIGDKDLTPEQERALFENL